MLHHAHLHNLKLETYVNPSAFFDCLSTPKLCTLDIIYRFYHVGSDFYASAANFLLRSSCTIVIFKWDSFDLCPIGFAHITQFMAELEELYVTTNCTAALARELLLDLTLNADEKSNFCPRLRSRFSMSTKESTNRFCWTLSNLVGQCRHRINVSNHFEVSG